MNAKAGQAGTPLPPVFASLYQAGIRPRTGQTMMIAAPPNCFKSGLALYWVVRLAQKGLRILYFSADTDEHDSKVRAASMLTGHPTEQVESAFLSDRGDFYDDVLEDLGSVRFSFETDPTYEYMAEEIQANAEIFGDYAHVIVVDNLMNVVTFHENEWSGMKEVTKALKRVGRQTGAAVFFLHHMNEGKDPRYPLAGRDVAGKVNQLPELILSLGMDDQAGILRVACVKNRSGKKDALGESHIDLYVDPDRMAIYSSRYDRETGQAV